MGLTVKQEVIEEPLDPGNYIVFCFMFHVFCSKNESFVTCKSVDVYSC